MSEDEAKQAEREIVEKLHAEFKLRQASYVEITEGDESMAGYVETVDEIKVTGNGQIGFSMMVDYGYGWFINKDTKVKWPKPEEIETVE